MGENSNERIRIQGQSRIEKWDLLRAALIFLVVLGHMVDFYVDDSEQMRGLFLFIYMFHMPCFLFLDGMFSKHNVDKKRFDRIFSYLVLYLVSKMLICLVNGIIHHQFTISLLSEKGIPWYALTLFWCNLLTIFLKRFSHRWVLVFSVVLACFLGYDYSIGDTLVLMRTIVFFPFFFAGYCVSPEQVAEKLSSKWAKALGLFLLATVAVICLYRINDLYFLRSLLTGRNSYAFLDNHEMGLASYGGLFRLGYYAIAAALCIAVIAIVPAHIPGSKAITGLGKRTLQVYVLHRPLVEIIYTVFHFNTVMAELGVSNLIVIPAALLLTMFCALPIWERPIRAIIYPKMCIQNKTVCSARHI